MKLNELFYSLCEKQNVQEAFYEISDELLVCRLLEYRDSLIESYEAVKDGKMKSIYVVNNLEEDAFQISLRIQSIDMILDEFKSDHEAYDFEAVEWWDDKEGLS
jgi:hypothetical protein